MCNEDLMGSLLVVWTEQLSSAGATGIHSFGDSAILLPIENPNLAGLDGVSKIPLLRHIATNVPENDVNRCGGQSLELGIAFMLTDSCQPTV